MDAMNFMTEFFEKSEEYTEEIFGWFSFEYEETNPQPVDTNTINATEPNSQSLQEADGTESVQSDSLCTKMFHVCIGTFHVTIGNTVTGLYNAIEDVVLLVIYLVTTLLFLIAAIFTFNYWKHFEGSLAYLELAGEAICFFVRDVLRAVPLFGHVIARVLDLCAYEFARMEPVETMRFLRYSYGAKLCTDRHNMSNLDSHVVPNYDIDF